jgi:DnaJ homolog subfamily C member 28
MKKRTLVASRLTDARERTLDYRLGMRHTAGGGGPGGRANPNSLKGWANLVEERIERARQAGHFRTIAGRGKPIKRHDDEGNPFIAREEFLMNRIVQKNGAAPPWVELQNGMPSLRGVVSLQLM